MLNRKDPDDRYSEILLLRGQLEEARMELANRKEPSEVKEAFVELLASVGDDERFKLLQSVNDPYCPGCGRFNDPYCYCRHDD